ncbi:hypothetical protein ANN_04038 [Periplaneta americana]|uniref:Uncharacterized protein n=1 Tax=Periplaneta americana TaxID=6978 RepID=A0ABQ8T7G2_PERAM|nr:hypothetical protein ANN_04038 [Periplaneta americana]
MPGCEGQSVEFLHLPPSDFLHMHLHLGGMCDEFSPYEAKLARLHILWAFTVRISCLTTANLGTTFLSRHLRRKASVHSRLAPLLVSLFQSLKDMVYFLPVEVMSLTNQATTGIVQSREAIEIKLEKNNFNRDSGLQLSQAWTPALDQLRPSYNQGREDHGPRTATDSNRRNRARRPPNFTQVHKRTRKVIAKKGKQQVGSIASGERGMTTTAVCCASAAGQYIPPMLIFKRTRAKDELMDGAPPGTVFAFNPDSGYINKELFVVVITEDVQNVHLLLEYRPHIDVSLTCEHDTKLQEYCVCPQNMPQFDSEGIPNQAPETNKPMILNGPTSRNREGDQLYSHSGHPRKLFSESSKKTMRRKTEHLREAVDPAALALATQISLKASGKKKQLN